MLTSDSDWERLLQRLRESGKRLSLVVTGGGTGAVARCFRREGASANFVEAVIPYSHAALADFLGGAPIGSHASGPVAEQIASVAFERAVRLAGEPADPCDAAGVALVAALPTTPRRRGQDRIHVAICTQSQRVLWSIELPKRVHSRQSAEKIADEMLYLALAELCGDSHGSVESRFFAAQAVRPVRTTSPR